MPVRRVIAQAHPSARPTPQGRHVGLGPRLVDEDEARRIYGALAVAPLPAAARNVRTVLLAGENAFFCGSGSRA
jgi:hypothetical protein